MLFSYSSFYQIRFFTSFIYAANLRNDWNPTKINAEKQVDKSLDIDIEIQQFKAVKTKNRWTSTFDP
ncbi:MAG: hypothetical protein WBI53_09180 [Paludibacter sp.]